MVDPLPVNNSLYVKALYRQKISTGKYKRHLRNIHYIIFLENNIIDQLFFNKRHDTKNCGVFVILNMRWTYQ